jgi:uncharacterized membrane protein
MIVLLIAVFAGMILIEVPRLAKKKYWRELAVYSLLMALAFAVCLLYTLHVDIPNPVKNTQYYIKNLFPFHY